MGKFTFRFVQRGAMAKAGRAAGRPVCQVFNDGCVISGAYDPVYVMAHWCLIVS